MMRKGEFMPGLNRCNSLGEGEEECVKRSEQKGLRIIVHGPYGDRGAPEESVTCKSSRCANTPGVVSVRVTLPCQPQNEPILH